MDEAFKTDSLGLNGETDSLKIDSKSDSIGKNLKSQNENTMIDNIENGDVDISTKKIMDNSSDSNSIDENDKKDESDSTPEKTNDAKGTASDKNSSTISENDDKDKLEEHSMSEEEEIEGTKKSSNISTSECKADDQKDDTEGSAKDSEAAEDKEDIDDENEEEKSKETFESDKEDESENTKASDADKEKEDKTDSTKESKKLFSESEASDDDDDASSGKWEAKNIILYNADEENYYKENKNRIQKEINKLVSCTACSKHIHNPNRSEVFTHPVLGVTICKKCTSFYGKGDFNKDEEGMDEYCRWCANGGELLLCDKCTNGFCKACVRRNMGRGALKDVMSQDEWSCYVCSLDTLMNIRALHRAIVENIRGKGPDSTTKSKKRETPATKRPSRAEANKKAESPSNYMTHSEDIKGLLLVFQKELQKIEKRQKSKDKVSKLKFHRRVSRLINLMQENFNRVKNEVDDAIKLCDDKESSNGEESEGLQEKIKEMNKKVKSGSKKRGYKEVSDEEEEQPAPKKRRTNDDDEDSVKIIKGSAKKRSSVKETPKECKNENVDDDDASESNDEEEDTHKSSDKKRLRVRSDLFSSETKDKSKGKKTKGTVKKSKDDESENESLPDILADSEEETSPRRSGRRSQTQKGSKNAKGTTAKGISKKKSGVSCIDLCSDDSETESPAKKRNSSKQKSGTPIKQTRRRRK